MGTQQEKLICGLRQFGIASVFVTSVLFFQVDPARAQNSFKVGMVAPLSGNFANYGVQIQQGVELAVENLKVSGITLHPVYEDACLPAAAVGAAKKLVTVEGIDALVGTYCVIGMAAMQPVFDSAKIPAFVTGVFPHSSLSGESTFTTNVAVRDEAFELATYATKNLNLHSAVILYIATQWGEEFEKQFRKRFSESGGKVLESTIVAIDLNDFRSELTRAKSKNPELIFAVHVGPNLGNIIKQARELGLKQPILTTDDGEEESVLKTAGVAAEGLILLSPKPTKDSDDISEFNTSFEKTYHAIPGILSANAYDATMITGNALQGCKGDKHCTAEKIRAVKNYSGVSGNFSIRAGDGADKPFKLLTVKDNKFVAVERN